MAEHNSGHRLGVFERCHGFLVSCARSMALCAESNAEREIVEEFTVQIDRKAPREFSPNPVPCLHSLELVKDMKLAKDFQQFAMYLPWTFSPRTIDQGREIAVFDFNDMFDLAGVTAGLIYVDVNQIYPEHNHRPDEMYFLISGTARWRWGGNHAYQNITAGNVIYNHPYNWHGVKAGPTPVLALYLQVR